MQPKSKARNTASSVCKLAATLALFYLTFRLVGKPLAQWPSLIESLHISLSKLAIALALLLLTVLVNSGKWILTLKTPLRVPISLGRALYYYCTGYFFNSFIKIVPSVSFSLSKTYSIRRLSFSLVSIFLFKSYFTNVLSFSLYFIISS